MQEKYNRHVAEFGVDAHRHLSRLLTRPSMCQVQYVIRNLVFSWYKNAICTRIVPIDL